MEVVEFVGVYFLPSGERPASGTAAEVADQGPADVLGRPSRGQQRILLRILRSIRHGILALAQVPAQQVEISGGEGVGEVESELEFVKITHAARLRVATDMKGSTPASTPPVRPPPSPVP